MNSYLFKLLKIAVAFCATTNIFTPLLTKTKVDKNFPRKFVIKKGFQLVLLKKGKRRLNKDLKKNRVKFACLRRYH